MFVLVGCGTGNSPEATASSQSDMQVLRNELRSAPVSSHIRELAGKIASGTGVSTPQTMRAVAALDHQAAESAVSGAIVGDHAPVFVVQMTGGTFAGGMHPQGAETPHGTVLTISFDVATHRVNGHWIRCDRARSDED